MGARDLRATHAPRCDTGGRLPPMSVCVVRQRALRAVKCGPCPHSLPSSLPPFFPTQILRASEMRVGMRAARGRRAGRRETTARGADRSGQALCLPPPGWRNQCGGTGERGAAGWRGTWLSFTVRARAATVWRTRGPPAPLGTGGTRWSHPLD